MLSAGTVMLGALAGGLQHGITNSSIIPLEAKQPLIEVTEKSVKLMSNSQLQSGLEAAGVGEIVTTVLNSIYSVARTDAFKAGVSLLIYGLLLGLVFSLWLSKRKLVVKDDPALAVSQLAES